MKRIYILILALCTSTITAFAWSNHAAATIAEIASRHLTKEAANNVKLILSSTPLASNANYIFKERKEGNMLDSKGWHYVEVDNNLNPKLNDDNNALTQIYKAVGVLQNAQSLPIEDVRHNLLVLTHLVSDIHCLANIRIENIEHSYRNFKVVIWNNRSGKRARYSNRNWRNFWGSFYASRRGLFSTAGYADEVMLYYRDDLKGFATGSPEDWVKETAQDAQKQLQELFLPEVTLRAEDVNRLEVLHERCLARAGVHLATILNNIFTQKEIN